MGETLSFEGVAATLGVSLETVGLWIERQELTSIKVYKRGVRVRRKVLEQFIRSRSTSEIRRNTPVEERDFIPLPPPIPPLMSIRRVAEALVVSDTTVSMWIRSGELVAVDVSLDRGSKGRRLRVHLDDLNVFLESRATRPKVQPRKRRMRR